MMNWRSRLTGIATGDQAIFVRRATFDAVGGYPAIPLMEDIRLSCARLRREAAPGLPAGVRYSTSARRWESPRRGGPPILLMWRLARLPILLWRRPGAPGPAATAIAATPDCGIWPGKGCGGYPSFASQQDPRQLLVSEGGTKAYSVPWTTNSTQSLSSARRGLCLS
jgi:hypothetical protein